MATSTVTSPDGAGAAVTLSDDAQAKLIGERPSRGAGRASAPRGAQGVRQGNQAYLDALRVADELLSRSSKTGGA